MALNAGARLGPYEISGVLGSGGMGEVYRARDTRLGREVAVKVLPAQFAREPGAIERFRREARLASTISHPHICAIYDTGDHDGLQYLVMELLEGQSLQQLIDTAPVPAARAVELGMEIADGLDAAHERGIIHRDLKPANVFVTTRGHAKILDFGVAKTASAAGDAETVAGLTSAGQAIGTVAYMSPEQARGDDVDARSDLFALGLILYEMLARKPAFGGSTTAMVFDAILNREPAPLRETVSGVPADLDRIIARLLAKSPDARPQTARAILSELRESQRAATAHTAARGSGAAAGAQASVAVLPFASLSPNPENEYLADGITEEVISALGQVKHLKVAGRTSSFAFKGKSPEVAEVGAKLGVSTVLTGGVRRAGNRLRITVELVSAVDGFQLWSERFDRPADDVFAIQDEIASGIAAKLKMTLSTGVGDGAAVRRGTENQEAHALYLRGRHLLAQRGEGVPKSVAAFEQAKALDPNFALAHAGCAEAYSLLGFYGYAQESRVMPAAKTAASRALELDPSLDEPHAALLMVTFLYEWNWAAATAEFDRAMAKNPNALGALTFRALELAFMHGRFGEALAMCARVKSIDPLSVYSYTLEGAILFTASRFADALAILRQADELHPNLWSIYRLIGLCHTVEDRFADAMAAFEKARVLSGDHPWNVMNMADAYRVFGKMDEAHRWAQAGLALADTRYVQPSVMGFLHATLGNMEEAFRWFDRACEERDLLPCLNYFGRQHIAASDPRWPVLMRRIGLEPAPPA